MFYALPFAASNKTSTKMAKGFEFCRQIIVQLANVTARYYGAFQTNTLGKLVVDDVHLGVIAR